MSTTHLHPLCCQPKSTGLLIIDIQEAFKKVIPVFDTVVQNASVLAKGFSLLGLPILATEQYPKGLGKTVEKVRQTCQYWDPVEKITFSCTLAEGFMKKVQATSCNHLVVCGIESHVCVNQTVLGLLHHDITVHIVTDAMASRKKNDHDTALRKIENAGAIPTTTELCLFELVSQAGTDEFINIQHLIK